MIQKIWHRFVEGHRYEIVSRSYVNPREKNPNPDYWNTDWVILGSEKWRLLKTGFTTVLSICHGCGETKVREIAGKHDLEKGEIK